MARVSGLFCARKGAKSRCGGRKRAKLTRLAAGSAERGGHGEPGRRPGMLPALSQVDGFGAPPTLPPSGQVRQRSSPPGAKPAGYYVKWGLCALSPNFNFRPFAS